MQLYCMQLARLEENRRLSDTIAGLAKLNNTRKAREVIASARDMLGGNGVLLENHVIRHMGDIEVIHTYEGTETMQTLIVGATSPAWAPSRELSSVRRARGRAAAAGRTHRQRPAFGARDGHRGQPGHVGAIRRARADREVVAFHPPGAGGSQRPPRPLRMGGLAAVVVSLLDELELGEVDVLGYSFGGGLAQELARRAPDRVRRLILCATAPGLGGIPPWPYPALLLASPARYYHPWAFASRSPASPGRTDASPRCSRPGRARLGRARPPRLRIPALRHLGVDEPAVAAPH